MTRPVHLGLDVGGTASRWVACAADGALVARGEASGATGHLFNPAERARLTGTLDQIGAALSSLGLEAVSLAGGMTGYGHAVAGDVQALVGARLGLDPDRIAITDDVVLAYAASFAPGQGHLISAGTGSIGVHIGTTGEMTRVGGRGILIDDAGSGSWIALSALDRMYRALDRDGSFATVAGLASHVFAQIGGATWTDVRSFVYAGDRGRIGTLAVAVAAAADQGDPTARTILDQAGRELAGLAQALLTRCGQRPVHLSGGVLRLHSSIVDGVRGGLPGTDVVVATTDAALAAARRGMGEDPWKGMVVREADTPR